MQFMLMFPEGPSEFATREDPEASGPYWGAWGAYAKALAESGVLVYGAGLNGPAAATTIRLRDGKRHVQDGPYADTKEQLGGIFVIEVRDLDAAIEWAARSPCASATAVEIRPVLPPPPA